MNGFGGVHTNQTDFFIFFFISDDNIISVNNLKTLYWPAKAIAGLMTENRDKDEVALKNLFINIKLCLQINSQILFK